MSNETAAPVAYMVVFGSKKHGNYRVESVHANRDDAQAAVDSHPHRNSAITRTCDKARIVEFDLGILTWDISDAFAKTEDEHGLDLDPDAITAMLPAFINAVLTGQREMPEPKPRQCYVALTDLPGQDTKAVRVYEDVNDAYDWAQSSDAVTVQWAECVDFIPRKA